MTKQELNMRLMWHGVGGKWFPRLMKRADQLELEDFKDKFGVCMQCEDVILVSKICCDSVKYDGRTYNRNDFRWT